MKKQRTISYLTVVLVLILQACNLPSSAPTGEPTPDPLAAAQMTITALALQQEPTVQAPTQEILPTFTALPILSPTPAVNDN